MSRHAHGTQRGHDGATKQPTSYVRTAQGRRKPIGWLECSADEFFRLLALHRTGKINLLAMPETSTDTIDDELDDELDDDATEQAAPEVSQRQPMTRNKASAGMVRQVVAKAQQPMTIVEIARKAQLSPAAVRAVVLRGKDFFVCAGIAEDGHTKLWTRKV